MSRQLLSLSSILAGFYALLIFLPFSYRQFIMPRLFPEVQTLFEWLPWIIAVALVISYRLFRKRNFGVWIFALGTMVTTLAMNLFSNPQPGFQNYVAALMMFATAIAIQWDTKEWESTVHLESLDFICCVLCMCWSFLIRLPQAHPDQILWLLFLKLLLIVILIACLSLFRHFLPKMALTGFHTLLYFFLFEKLILPAISLRGFQAILASFLIALALSLNVTAFFRTLWRHPKYKAALGLVLLTILAFQIDGIIRRFDWNGTGQDFFTLFSTTLAGILISSLVRDFKMAPFRGYHPYLAGLVFLVIFEQLGGFQVKLGQSPAEQLMGKMTELGRSNEADLLFFQFLDQNSNLPNSTQISPTPISFGSPPFLKSSQQPHIFIFVIDSLRKDYVNPFNPSVKFTPQIQKFANENLVFKKSFTRYGATGLSEPSIWSGALVPHKQYVLPFMPFNSLEKLLIEQGYSQWVSMDEILKQILTPTPKRFPLDEGTPPRDFRLCQTLQEIQSKMHQAAFKDQPIFVYTQSQDLHVSVLSSGSRSPSVQNEFQPEYAEALFKLDQCLGSFIENLKKEGLYDNSIIVLTSDHGDSLGEEGRFGHAYTLYPEIVQIPLLLHVPKSMREKFVWDVEHVVFNTDISPTLYALLGVFEEKDRPSIFGLPLFQAPQRSGPYLLASSYGPVFALLNDDGTELYIADGVQLRESLFTIGPAVQEKNLDRRLRDQYREALRAQIERVSRFYRYEEHP